MSDDIQTFDPVLFSISENKFLLEHLGTAPVIARKAAQLAPVDVNPKAVNPIIERVYELQELNRVEGTVWVGIAALKDRIKTYIEQSAKWAADAKRNKRAPRYPSLLSFDAKGRGHRGGPGSDSGRVRTYFGKAGERLPFEIHLFPETQAEWVAPGFDDKPSESTLFVDPSASRIECRVPQAAGGICGHTESYKEGSRSSFNAARARMSKHLRKASNEVEAHIELHTNEFGN
jgi:hypothetical protein